MFKQYLDHTKNEPLREDLVSGGLRNMFKHLEYWFVRSPEKVSQRIAQLEEELINAGGARKFAIIVRRIPSVRNFIKKHANELEGKLAKVAKLI